MRYQPLLFTVLLVLPLGLLTGCGNGGNPANGSASDSAKPEASAGKTASDDLPGLKKLSAADRKLAEKQKFCPVSGGRLGESSDMDVFKMTVKGRTIFLCCPDCEDEVKKDPDKYLKKVDELLAKK